MAIKKIKKDFWEEIFPYPSFNIRFTFILISVLIGFSVFSYFLFFYFKLAENSSDLIAALNLIIQFATLVLGIFAAYYALRQLVETRFTSLDSAGMQELQSKHYIRAFEKWREAFYIRPDSYVFTNMCETLLLIGDFDTFDQYIKMSQKSTFLNKGMFQEISDQLAIIYLKVTRNLLVENLGEAKKYINELIELTKTDNFSALQWNFNDLRTSEVYLGLNPDGESRKILENVINYLSKTMQPVRLKEFESRQFASQNMT